MLVGILKTMRPHQWVKNLFVLAPLIFAKELFDRPMAIRATIAFFLFSFVSSAVYLINDIADVEADRAHPIKQKRPIASGRVPVNVAKGAAATLALIAIGGGFLLSPAFCGAVASYFVLNLAYTAKLKRIAYVDVLCIATGFELRVLAGAFAALVPPSTYLLLVTFLLALFLGFGKRMHELKSAENVGKTRKVLEAYSDKALTILLGITGLATVGTYVIYTLDPKTRSDFGTNYLAVTTVFTLFGVLRFLHLVRGRPAAESPTEEMLRDKPFLANLVLWVVAVLVTIYLG